MGSARFQRCLEGRQGAGAPPSDRQRGCFEVSRVSRPRGGPAAVGAAVAAAAAPVAAGAAV
eukprot:2320777-Pyramimonas_sp.AAC.1